MKIGIIVGSHRKESQSTKVSKFVEERIKQNFQDTDTYIFDLRNNPIPLWDESAWEENSKLTKQFDRIKNELESCDGFVIISPEWSGMATPGLKNFFLYVGNSMSHKPAMLIGVSASRGGSYPIAELRMSSYKNTRLVYIPDHVIVHAVEHVLNDFEMNPENEKDKYIKERIDYSIKILNEYSKALEKIRHSEIIDFEKYPYGM